MAVTSERTCHRLFWGFCLLHALLWCILPFFGRGNLPFDTVEAIAWGGQWQWGYDKHPYLAPWLIYLSFLWGKGHVFFVYLFAQLNAVLAFWGVWRLALMLAPLVLPVLIVGRLISAACEIWCISRHMTHLATPVKPE